MDIDVREQRLPGVGMRYDIDIGDERQLFVIIEHSGRRLLGLSGDADRPIWQTALDQDSALMLAALLLGARFTIDTSGDAHVDTDEVVVDIVEVTPDSPAVGRTKSEIALADPEAMVLAVISDSTPDLVEDEARHRCRPGDRIVVASRAAQIDEVVDGLGVRAETVRRTDRRQWHFGGQRS